MRRSLERERRVIATIVFLVGAPGIVLTWLGIRLVRSEEKEVERRERAHYAAVAADADLAVSRALGFHAESVRDLAERLGPRVGSLDEAREVLAGSLEKEGVYERLHLVGPDGRLLEAHDAKTAAPAPPATVADESHPALASARRLEFVASDPAAARAEYERIVRSGPTDDGLACLARVGVARCFAKTGAREEALSALEQVVSRHPFATDTSGMAYSLGARLEMARIHADLGRDDSARWTLLDLAEFLLAHGDRLPADQVAYCWARCREALTRETSGPLAHGEPDAIAARWAEIETARRAPREGERERVEFEAAVGPWLREWLARDVPAPRLPIPVHFEDGWRPVIAARLRRDPEAPPLGAAVAVLDRERVLGDVVAPALAARSLEPDAVWIVTDMEGRPVVGELPEGSREPWIEVPLSALPYYRLSARAASGMGGNSSASTGPLLVWALVLSVGSIAAGLYVALRTVSREIASSRIQSDFVSSVTHELKTPLTAIQIFVETLREGRVEGPRETRECLDLLAAEAATLSRLIQRILD
ncbi:MAG: hypothetical protein HY720_31965, partial [Planctomycetes bacterium]|nr:hypothetical protein [Planctomycetota bacterium]